MTFIKSMVQNNNILSHQFVVNFDMIFKVISKYKSEYNFLLAVAITNISFFNELQLKAVVKVGGIDPFDK